MPEVRDSRRLKRASGELAPVAPALPALARDRGNFFTRAGGEGSVYGEVVRRDAQGARWRRWDPHRSKAAAALAAGGVTAPFEDLLRADSLLYLGAASGTTVSHLADVFAPRPVFAVEVATRSFQDLLTKLKPWANVFPVLGDARTPEAYAALVGRAGALVQDVAQADPVEILEANCRALLAPGAVALLFVKAPSVSSAADPERVFTRARAQLAERGLTILEERTLEPFDLAHRAFLVRWRG